MKAPFYLTLNSPQETVSLAAQLGETLQPGDTILLEGAIGSGKTHFARALVQSILAEPEDIPSPTFTLVQIYNTRVGEVWHSDLYRLSSIDEFDELGLVEAFDTSICLIEWPEKMGALAPRRALLIKFTTDSDDQDTRHLVLSWSDPRWCTKLEFLS